MFLGLLDNFVYLVIVHGVLLAVGREDHNSEYGELPNRRHHDEGFLVELCLVPVVDDLSLGRYLAVRLGNDGDQEVHHDNEHEERLEEPCSPNQVYVQRFQGGVWLCLDCRVFGHG